MQLHCRSNFLYYQYKTQSQLNQISDCTAKITLRNKHSQLLIRVVPHMDQMDRVLPYLAELGALHQRHGVAKQHIDLLGLAFCAAIRGVVQVRPQGHSIIQNISTRRSILGSDGIMTN